jgi:hypothetical protein
MKITAYQTNAMMLKEMQRVIHQTHLKELERLNRQAEIKHRQPVNPLTSNKIDVYA